MNRRILFIVFCLPAILTPLAGCYPQKRPGGKLGLSIVAELKFEPSNSSIEGWLDIQNLGTEDASAVEPLIQVDDWNWRGAEISIEHGEKFRWQVNQSADAAKLIRSVQNQSAEISAELAIVPLLIGLRYEDEHGKSFSTAGVKLITVRTSQDQTGIAGQTPNCSQSISAVMKCNSSGKHGRCRAEIMNISPAPLTIQNRAYSATEIQILNQPKQITLPPGQSADVQFEFSGEKAFPGSRYTVYLISEWSVQQALCSTFTSGRIPMRRNGFRAEIAALFVTLFVAAAVLHKAAQK